jgi:hypothetical protein
MTSPLWLAVVGYVVVHGPALLTEWNNALADAVARWRKTKQ